MLKKYRLNNWIYLALTFLFFGCSHQSNLSESDLKPLKIIIDVRTQAEFESGHLENAINIPHTQIKEKIKDYVTDLNQPIMLYCRSGRRSGIALKALEELGYVNAVNAGAYKDLINN